ncbi:MAG: MarR family transcriptional regulator [Proteobacteria bacterium]|nr:MAG: MarR family transcriptional regulator [Pseudomonadota bacterium]
MGYEFWLTRWIDRAHGQRFLYPANPVHQFLLHEKQRAVLLHLLFEPLFFDRDQLQISLQGLTLASLQAELNSTRRTVPSRKGRPGSGSSFNQAGHLASQLMELYPRLLRELRYGMDPAGHAQLTISQCRILAFVADEPSTNKALAAHVGVSVAATSRMVDGLVSRGFLERIRDENDKRQCHLHLSPEGRKHFLSFRRTAEAVLVKRLKAVAGGDLLLASKSLDLLLRLFEAPAGNT